MAAIRPPHGGIDFLGRLQQRLRELGVGSIASICGRYYAMDRDNRWERTELAYRAVVHGEAKTRASDPEEALRKSYEQGLTDEFVLPIVLTAGTGAAAAPVGCIRDDDAVVFFNFRADRARQMTRAIAEPGFDKFIDPERPANLSFVGMTQYDKSFPWLRFVFGSEKLEHILANVFAEVGFRNLRVAGNREICPRHLTALTAASKSPSPARSASSLPSPKVPTYDLMPEMSAAGIADAVVHAIEKGAIRRH